MEDNATVVVDKVAKKAEIMAFFKKEMEESKKKWATRGKEARMAAHQARLTGPRTWRHMKGMELLMHEARHPGNYPFVIGFGICGLVSLYVSSGFTDEMKKSSDYWQAFHAKK